jgi:hypothetical protein
MESIIRNVKDIETAERHVYERVLGEQLRENQQVFIMVMTPNVEPDSETRRKALAEIERLSRKAAAHAKGRGATDQQINEAIDEAVEHVRQHPEK